MPHKIMDELHMEDWPWGYHVVFWLAVVLLAVGVALLIRRFVFPRT